MDHEVNWFMTTDTHAQINVIRGAWMLPLWRQGHVNDAIIAQIGTLQKREQDWFSILESRWALAQIQMWSIAEILNTPQEILFKTVQDIAAPVTLRAYDPPPLLAIDGLDAYLVKLRNHGMPTNLLKDFQV
jgi:hypothetical protein